MNTEYIQLDIDNHIAHVRLNKTNKINAICNTLLSELVSIGEQLNNNSEIRAIVLSGNGKGFSSGLDTSSFSKMMEGDNSSINIQARDFGICNLPQQAVLQWQTISVPVIAAIHGVAYGGGLQLCLGTDIRIMHPDTKLCVAEINWGLIPDMAGSLLLPELIGRDKAIELTCTGRVFDGKEAHQLGLATQLCDAPIDSAIELAQTIANKNPDAIKAAKRLLRSSTTTSFSTTANSSEAILRQESDEQNMLIGSPNQNEAVAAAIEKRTAKFT